MSVFEIRDNFYLNGKPVKIISGAIHYFRIVPEYWRDRLEKLKARWRCRSRLSAALRGSHFP